MEIIVDGVAYWSWDDVPAQVRTAIATSGAPPVDPLRADEPPDGGPLPVAPPSVPVTFALDGRTYQSIDDVPGEIREALRAQLLATPPPTVEPRLPRVLAAGVPPAPIAPVPATAEPVDDWSSTAAAAARSPIVMLTIAVVVIVVIAALIGMNLKT